MTCAAVIAPLKWLAIALPMLTWKAPEVRACSLADPKPPELLGRILPEHLATVCPRPLLAATWGDPTLTTTSGATLAISRTNDMGAMKTWRPSEPLPTGQYFWSDPSWGRPVEFFVDPDLPSEPVPIVTNGKVVVVLDDETAPACDSCTGGFDPSHVSIRFTTNAEDVMAILQLSAQGRSTGSVGGQLGPKNSIIFGAHQFPRGALTQDRVCASITLVTLDGIVGPTADLGCTDPDTGKGIDDRTGCASAQTTDGLAWLLGLALIAWRRLTMKATA